MRNEYAFWFQREDFQKLARTSPIVHAAICADAAPVDLVLAMGARIAELEKQAIDHAMRQPVQPFIVTQEPR